jgi:sterol desaturase/sphingolipid hydroxylase (fatty acid hydroxylase superfamily)
MVLIGSMAALVTASVVVALAERTGLRRSARSGRRRYIATDLAWYAVTIGSGAIAAIVFRPLFERITWSVTAELFRRQPLMLQVIVAVAVYDLVAYAAHVAYHRSNRLWEFHKVHHSSLHLDGLATTRTHMFELFTRSLPAQAAVLLLGLQVGALGVALGVYAVFAVIGHADLVLPRRPLEPLLITPRLHHRHHVPAAANSNYGTIFSVWDRMFGTFNSTSAPADGLVGVPGERETFPQRFVPAAREPFKRVLHWQPPARERLTLRADSVAELRVHHESKTAYKPHRRNERGEPSHEVNIAIGVPVVHTQGLRADAVTEREERDTGADE